MCAAESASELGKRLFDVCACDGTLTQNLWLPPCAVDDRRGSTDTRHSPIDHEICQLEEPVLDLRSLCGSRVSMRIGARLRKRADLPHKRPHKA